MASIALTLLVSLAAAQFPPKPEGVKVLRSKHHDGVTLSYKEPGLCETTPGVKSYAGYVHLPVEALNETFEHNGYPINTFYWFFESRKDPHNAPLAIWLNGGPGGSSLLGALSENGPCFVSNDSKSTYLNPWSWNNEANLLFIDQPNQVGYSYDVLTNVTVNLIPSDSWLPGGDVQPTDFSDGVPEQNNTFLVGTSSSQKVSSTANSTQHAATAIWHFAQTWFEEFPQYKPDDERISLFTESFGGHYGPGFMDYFIRQNDKITRGEIPRDGAHYMHLSTLGIVNGCIDAPDMFESEIIFAYNNTYGIQAISQDDYEWSMNEFHKPGGVLDDLRKCREAELQTDPHNHSTVAATNKICSEAGERAENISDGMYEEGGRHAPFDITHDAQDSFPPSFVLGWLNQVEVQQALGVPVNHSWFSQAVSKGFSSTGDIAKGGQLEQLRNVLEHGITVALLYGDRDFACNWIGGERYSLNVPWSGQAKFRAAGYTPLVLSEPYTQSGGLVRQYGNLSFTRVYQAGHMVPSYQPEAAYRIFMRALTHHDIATGTINTHHLFPTTTTTNTTTTSSSSSSSSDDDEEEQYEYYSTTGPSDTWWRKNDVLPGMPHVCYTLDPLRQCTEEEVEWIRDGTAVVKDWILVGRRNVSDSDSGSQVERMISDGEGQVPFKVDL